MFKLTVLYGHPTGPNAFERYYAETHLPLAEKIPGLQRFEIARVVGTPDGSPAPYYRLADLYFESQEKLQAGMASPEGQAAVADLANFATGGVTVLISEVRKVR
jgi:uncharacterized protein (TIGR02118 family)